VTDLAASILNRGQPSQIRNQERLMRGKVNPILAWSARIYGIGGALIFFLSGVVYLFLGRWSATHQDFWVFYDTWLHRSWLSSSILKYNGHSCFFPCQIWLGNLRWFHGSQDSLFVIGLMLELAATTVLLFPVWKDRSVDSITRIAATVAIVFGNFWMGRASMTASGAFNCAYSLVLLGAALAFLGLPAIANEKARILPVSLAMVCAAVLASFSFGTGLAVWGALLLTGFCLKIRLRRLAIIAGAAVLSVVVFLALPPHTAATSFGRDLPLSQPATYLTLFTYFCRLLGSPWLYIFANWSGNSDVPGGFYEGVAMVFGVLGFLFVIIVSGYKVCRRNLRLGLEVSGFALMIFNFVAFGLVTLARAGHIAQIPSELNAPRYLYWSALFWTGLLLVLLGLSENRPRLSWAAIWTVMSLPLLAFPSHLKEARRWHYVRLLSQTAATSLVNGVCDKTEIRILSPFPELVYRISKEMKARRLDMFAPDYAEWIGHPAAALFSAGPASVRLSGQSRMRALESASPAVRIDGRAIMRARRTPDVLVILDSNGTLRGIARSSATPDWLNHYLYGRIFQARSFVGYIAPYERGQSYVMRSVEHGALSAEAIAVPLVAKPKAERP